MCVIQGQRPPTLPPNDNYIRIRVCARTYCPLVHQPRLPRLLDGGINVLKCISTIRFPFFLSPSPAPNFSISLFSLFPSLFPFHYTSPARSSPWTRETSRLEEARTRETRPIPRRDVLKKSTRVKWGYTQGLYND